MSYLLQRLLPKHAPRALAALRQVMQRLRHKRPTRSAARQQSQKTRRRKLSTINLPTDLSAFVKKLDQLKQADALDLSLDEDLSLAVMNLVSIEEHFFFTGAKTGKHEFFDLLDTVRSMRKELLARLLKNPEGEEWCLSKHLLAASMRLMECGTKQQTLKNPSTAHEFFQKAYDLYCLFWGINLKAVDVSGIKKIGSTQLNTQDRSPGGVLGSLRNIVQKVIDCCIE